MKRAPAAILLLGAAAGLAGAGCHATRTGEPQGGAPDKQLLELFSWWSAPGEAEALEALIDTHRYTHPGVRVFNAVIASGAAARTLLDDRLAHDDPPDLFQEYVHDLRADVHRADGKRQPLDDLVDRLGLRQVIFPEVLREVTRDGHVQAMPVNVHRENTLFYNRRLFAAHGLKPPTTVAELLEVCKTLKAAGVTPMATAHQGWILRIMFNSLVLGKMGTDRYRDYFTGKTPADVPLLRESIKVFADVLENYTNADAGEEGFNWTNAAQAVYNGDAAMFLHGDWVKGYLVQLGWSPDFDFGAVASPGGSDIFLYGIDVFALPVGARNETGARDFLATAASIAGQVAFNRIKGSSPIRSDVPPEQLDSLGRATLNDLQHARIRMLVRSRPLWEDALAAFARNGDREALLRAFIESPPGA